MAGLEVDGLTNHDDLFSGVVVGKLESVNVHPDSDKLSTVSYTHLTLPTKRIV